MLVRGLGPRMTDAHAARLSEPAERETEPQVVGTLACVCGEAQTRSQQAPERDERDRLELEQRMHSEPKPEQGRGSCES